MKSLWLLLFGLVGAEGRNDFLRGRHQTLRCSRVLRVLQELNRGVIDRDQLRRRRLMAQLFNQAQLGAARALRIARCLGDFKRALEQ